MEWVAQAGWSNAVAATLLAVLAAVVGFVVRRPALTHGLWLLVLIKRDTPLVALRGLRWTSHAPGPTPGALPSVAEDHCCDAWVVAARPESAQVYARVVDDARLSFGAPARDAAGGERDRASVLLATENDDDHPRRDPEGPVLARPSGRAYAGRRVVADRARLGAIR